MTGLNGTGARPGISIQQLAIDRIDRESRRIESRSFPVPRVAVFFAVSSKQTDAQAQVQREVVSYLPVILKIRLRDLVTLVVAVLSRNPG